MVLEVADSGKHQ